MANDCVPTLQKLMLSFQNKIDVVKDSLLLVKVQDDPDCVEMVSRVQLTLRQLQMTLTLLRTEVTRQKQALGKIQDMSSTLELFMRRVLHAQNNIPQHMPKSNPVVEQAREEVPISVADPPSASEPKNPVPVTRRKHTSGTRKPVPQIGFLTVDEFESVPKYMKGRITYEIMNNAVTEINKAFTYKQNILTMPRNKQSVKTKNEIVAYKEQETKASDGFFFIVDNDLTSNTRFKLDNAGRNCLTILRHCGRIKEVRGGHIIRYCLLLE